MTIIVWKKKWSFTSEVYHDTALLYSQGWITHRKQFPDNVCTLSRLLLEGNKHKGVRINATLKKGTKNPCYIYF
jgi:hypothetical protein